MRGQSFRSFALCYLCCLLFKKRAQKIRAQFEQEVAEEAERCAGRVSDHPLSAISAASCSKRRAQKIRATACRLFVRFIFVPVNLLHFEAAKKTFHWCML